MATVQAPSRFEFRRHIDDVVYIFDRVATADGRVRYKPSDADLWVIYHDTHGWAVWDEVTRVRTHVGRQKRTVAARQVADRNRSAQRV